MSYTFTAQLKTEKGTGASRRLRRIDQIPAIIYGNDQTAISVTLDHNKLLHAMEHDAFYTQDITIEMEDGTKEIVRAKALQHHAFKPKLLHADFQRV